MPNITGLNRPLIEGVARQLSPITASKRDGRAASHTARSSLRAVIFPAVFRNTCPFRLLCGFLINVAAIMGRSACPVNGAARSVRPCGPPVLAVSLR